MSPEGAILRPFRENVTDICAEPDWRTESPKCHDQLSSSIVSSTLYSFQPSLERCCQTGKRVAKKNMVCDVAMLAVLRKYFCEKRKHSDGNSNRSFKLKPRKQLIKLWVKIDKCTATCPKYFEKCCSEHKDFLKHTKKCQMKPKRQRRQCKQKVKKLFLNIYQGNLLGRF